MASEFSRHKHFKGPKIHLDVNVFNEFEKNFITGKNVEHICSEGIEQRTTTKSKRQSEVQLEDNKPKFNIKKVFSKLTKNLFRKGDLDLASSTFFLISSKNSNRSFSQVLLLKLKYLLEKCPNVPIVHPFNPISLTLDLVLLLNTSILFFWIPLDLSLDVMSEKAKYTFHILEAIFYVFQLFLNMNTAYFHGGAFVQDRWKIFRNYFRKKFLLLDVLTVCALIATAQSRLADHYFPFFMSLVFYGQVKIFIYKFNKIQEFFALKIHLKGSFDFILLLLTLFFFTHFFACFFIFIALSSNSVGEENWLRFYGLIDQPAADQYIFALHWATSTIFSSGYGEIIPKNNHEKAFSMFATVLCFFLYCYSLLKVYKIFIEKTDDCIKTQKKIAKISRFMEAKKLHPHIQMKVRSHLKFSWKTENERINQNLSQILDNLSCSLKDEVYKQAYGPFFDANPFLKEHFSEEFIGEISKNVEEKSFFQGDVLFERDSQSEPNICFVKVGEIELFHSNHENNHRLVLKTVNCNESFGYYSFITGFRPIYSARALLNSKLYMISRKNFMGILSKYTKDFEHFCELRDRILLYNEFSYIDVKCRFCQGDRHIINTCKTINNIFVDRSAFLRKYQIGRNNERAKFKRRNKRVNALKLKKKIVSLSQEILSFSIPKIDHAQSIEERGIFDDSGVLTEEEEEGFLLKENNAVSTESFDEKFKKKAFTELKQRTSSMNYLEYHKNRAKPDIDRMKAYEFYFNKQNPEMVIRNYNKLRGKKRKITIDFDKLKLDRIMTDLNEEHISNQNQIRFFSKREKPISFDLLHTPKNRSKGS